MSRVWLVLGGDGLDLLAPDTTQSNALFRFRYASGGWAARVAFVPRDGESYVALGNSQAIEAATGLPVSAAVGTNPKALPLSNGALSAMYGGRLVMGFPCPAGIAKADIGSIMCITAGVLAKSTATTDNPLGILSDVPDAGTAALAEVVTRGPVLCKGIAAGVTVGQRLVLGAGIAKVPAAADFNTSAGAGVAATGARALGMALETKGANVDFLLDFGNYGSPTILT